MNMRPLVPDRLYHCMNKAARGDALLPTCAREVNGRMDHYLFAATHLTKALAFAFDYYDAKGGILCNGSLGDTEDEYAIICDSERILSQPMSAQVFSFASRDFVSAGERTRQCVSTKPVPFAEAEIVLRIQGVDDLMQNGLQILTVQLARAELDFARLYNLEAENHLDWLSTLIVHHDFEWLNQKTGINPNRVLLSAVRDKQNAACRHGMSSFSGRVEP